ncbi:MAG: hypothetical protein WDZ41_04685 [Candidatus Babeliales bacterium]
MQYFKYIRILLILIFNICAAEIALPEASMPQTSEEVYSLYIWYQSMGQDIESIKDILEKKEQLLQAQNLSAAEEKKIVTQIKSYKEIIEKYQKTEQFLKQPEIQSKIHEFTMRTSALQELENIEKEIFNPLRQALLVQDSVIVEGLFNEFKKRLMHENMSKELASLPSLNAKINYIKAMRIPLHTAQEIVIPYIELMKTEEFNSDFIKIVQKFNQYIDQQLAQLDQNTVNLYKKEIAPRTKVSPSFSSKKQFAEFQQIVKKIKKEIAPSLKLIEELENLENKAEQGDNKSYIKRRLQIIQTHFDKKKIEQLRDINNNLQKLTGNLLALTKRYKGKYPTLFDSQYEEYQAEFKGSDFNAFQAYQALGLDPKENPEHITQEQIDKAYELQRKQLKQTDKNWLAARNASTILRDQIGKQTYDAFLTDHFMLRKLGIDSINAKSKPVEQFLNTNSALAQLQITKDMHDRILQFYPEVNELFSKVGSALNIIETLPQQIENIETLLQ